MVTVKSEYRRMSYYQAASAWESERGVKQETLITSEENIEWSDIGMRESRPNEKMHLRFHQSDRCSVCGKINSEMWTDDAFMHRRSLKKCERVLISKREKD